jgi:hypothetical protein
VARTVFAPRVGRRAGRSVVIGYPEVDPHGHIIPHKHQGGMFRDEIALNNWPPAKRAMVTSVSDRDPADEQVENDLNSDPAAAAYFQDMCPESRAAHPEQAARLKPALAESAERIIHKCELDSIEQHEDPPNEAYHRRSGTDHG